MLIKTNRELFDRSAVELLQGDVKSRSVGEDCGADAANLSLHRCADPT